MATELLEENVDLLGQREPIANTLCCHLQTEIRSHTKRGWFCIEVVNTYYYLLRTLSIA